MEANQAPTNQTTPPANSKKTNLVLIAIIIILALVVIGGGIGYYAYYRLKKSAQKSTNEIANTSPAASEEGKMPDSDVAGTDLTDVPRYPNSIRFNYQKSEAMNYTQIQYKVKATSDEILNYYKKQMPSLGWTLISSENKSLSYSKELNQVSITVNDTVNSITSYQLDYLVLPSD